MAVEKEEKKAVVIKPKAKRRRKSKKEEVVGKEVDFSGEKGVGIGIGNMADGSGGVSANKGTEEEEGSIAPFPERVGYCFIGFRFFGVLFMYCGNLCCCGSV